MRRKFADLTRSAPLLAFLVASCGGSTTTSSSSPAMQAEMKTRPSSPADGEGLHRQGHGARNAVDRSDDRAPGAAQEAGRLRLLRSAQRRPAGCRRRRAGSREGHRLGLPHSRRPGLRAGTHDRAQPGDRAQAGRHHPGQRGHAGTGAGDPPGRDAGHQAGWLAHRTDSRSHQRPPVFTNVTTDPREVAKAAALYAVVDSNGTANVIHFKDSITTISTAKTNASLDVFKECAGCKVLETETRRWAIWPTACRA